MTTAVLGLAAEKFMQAAIDLLTDDIKVSLIDADDIGTAVTGATNATPIVITSASHGLTSGQRVLIVGVGGNTAANGVFLVTVSDVNTFSLQALADGSDVAGSGAFTSGGRVIALDEIEFYDEISAGEVGVSGNLSSKSVTGGVFDAANTVINSVSGDPIELVAVWQDTGNDATSPVLAFLVGSFTPDGNNVNVNFDASGIFPIT